MREGSFVSEAQFATAQFTSASVRDGPVRIGRTFDATAAAVDAAGAAAGHERLGSGNRRRVDIISAQLSGTFLDEVDEALDEGVVSADGGHPGEVETELSGGLLRLGVEIGRASCRERV